MHITPLEIRKHPFRKTFRGFDPDAVNSFLEMVAGEFEALIRSCNENASQAKLVEEKLAGYVRIEKTLNDTLIMAQRVADESRVNAQKEAEVIIKDATVRGHKEEQETRNRIAKLENELASLKNHRDSFLERFKGLLSTQQSLLGTISDDLRHDSVDGKPGSYTSNKELGGVSAAAQEIRPDLVS